MPVAEYQRKTLPFDCDGINLSLPVDRLPPNKYRMLENVRGYGDGQIQGRQGIQNVAITPLPVNDVVHSIKTFHDPIPSPTQYPGAFNPLVRAMGVGTKLTLSLDGFFFTSIESGMSGDPLSFVIADSDFSPRPHLFVGDSAKMRKINSAGFDYNMGIAPPNFAPTISIFGALGDGPDIGTTGVPYVHRFIAKADTQINSGAISNPGPPVREANGLSPSSKAGAPVPPSSILVTLPQAHPDPNVKWIQVYRFGGSLPEWIYIGTMNNIAANTMLDTNADADIASNPRLEFDNAQPFLCTDTSRQGTCTVAALGAGLGATVTLSGAGGEDVFRPYDGTGNNPYYPLGTQIIIAGRSFHLYASPGTTTTAELQEDPENVVGGPFQFFIPDPPIYHQPLPLMWGPFGGGLTGTFIFAVGDQLNPGALYWTKGNNPESHPARNFLQITSASEPLMNGCIYDGRIYVFSTQRMWAVYPNFGAEADFVAVEVPNGKGLYARWGLTVAPEGIYFIARDGIYLSDGSEPGSITGKDLYPLFPHEGSKPSAVFTVDGLENTEFAPPNWVNEALLNAMRLCYGDGFVYFDYIDAGADPLRRTLVYDTDRKVWPSRDSYGIGISVHYFEEGENEHRVLMGSTNGALVEYSGAADVGEPIIGHIRTGAFDSGDVRPRKFWGDFELDMDTLCEQLDVLLGFDNFTYFSALSTVGLNLTGRRQSVADINLGKGQYARNLGLDIQWTVSTSSPVFYSWTPTWRPTPEITGLRVTIWDDAGYQGLKFFQGFRLRSDTLGLARSVQVLSDGNLLQQTFTITNPTEQWVPYVFTTPFLAHLVRLWPQDANFWRIWDIEWIWEPAPEFVTTWITQETTYDLQGYCHHRDAYIPVVSNGLITWQITVDGTNYTYTIPSTVGAYLKNYLVLQPMKGKYAKHSLTSPFGFQLFQKDCEVRVKPWGDSGAYKIVRPFGDQSRLVGARI